MEINLSKVCKANLVNANITINGNKLYVNGKLEQDFNDYPEKEFTLIIEGNVRDVDVSGSLQCGNVEGDVDCSGSMRCGSIGGDVDCSGSINCGNIYGDVDCAGSIRITN